MFRGIEQGRNIMVERSKAICIDVLKIGHILDNMSPVFGDALVYAQIRCDVQGQMRQV